MTKPTRSVNSANAALLQAVWKKANTYDGVLEIPCGTAEEARRLRSALYNVTRNARKNPDAYPELVEAVDNCEVTINADSPAILRVGRKALSPRMQALKNVLEGLGVAVNPSDIQGTPETREIAASAARLTGEAPASTSPQPPEAPAVPNPYGILRN